MTTTTKQSFLFMIDGTYAIKNDLGTILTGYILNGTMRLNDQAVYVGKNQIPVFECKIVDIERMPMTKLKEASAEEMGKRSISLQIFGNLKHEFETGGFIMNTE